MQITYEIEIRDRTVYVRARNEAQALKKVQPMMSAIERRFVTPVFTGRNR